MKKFLKLSTTALLLSGMTIGGATMAAVIFKAPILRADSGRVLVGRTITINVAANDVKGSTAITKYTAGTARYGTVSCTIGFCKYTYISSKAMGKASDSFTYTVTYKDAKGKLATQSAVVIITIHDAPSPSLDN